MQLVQDRPARRRSPVQLDSHEYLRTVHSPPDRDHAAYRGGCAGGRHRVPAAASVATAASGFPDHFGVGFPARRESGDHGVVGGDAAGAPVGPYRGGYRDDFVEHTGVDQHHAAVRSESQHRRRGPGCAGGHQRGARLSAGESAEQPELSQSESRGLADFYAGADLRPTVQGPDVRRRVDHHGAEAVASDRRGASDGGRQRAAGRAGGVESLGPQQIRNRLRTGAFGPGRIEREHAQGRFSGRQAPLGSRRERSDFQGHRLPAPGDRLSQWKGRARFRCGRSGGFSGGFAQRGLRQRQAVGAGDRVPAARGEHHQYGRSSPRDASAAGSFHPARDQCASGHGSNHHHSRFGAGCRDHAGNFDRAGDPGGVRFPAQRAHHFYSERGGAGFA